MSGVTIAMARAKAFAMYPYLIQPLSRLALISKPGIGTMAVSAKWQVFYDPAALARWGLDGSAAVLAHEVWHLVRRHAQRRGARDPKLWNVACDIAINDDRELLNALPHDGLRWSQFPLSPNMLEEDIYDVLADQRGDGSGSGSGSGSSGSGAGSGSEPAPEPSGDDGEGKGQTPEGKGAPPIKDHAGKEHGKRVGDGDCGSGAGGVAGPWEDDPDAAVGDGGEGMSETEAALMERAVAEAVQSCGKASVGARRWAGGVLAPPVVPWQQVLKVALTRAIRMVPGATDYSYTRARMRSGVLMPRMRKPSCPVAIVLDTSGSVSGPLLDAALAEVDGILKTIRVPCTVLACDAQVHGGAQKVTSARDVKPLGGGGTDMGVGIRAADELVPRHGAIVVLTDGYTPWPDASPRGPCIVALIGGSDAAASRIPAWATVARVA